MDKWGNSWCKATFISVDPIDESMYFMKFPEQDMLKNRQVPGFYRSERRSFRYGHDNMSKHQIRRPRTKDGKPVRCTFVYPNCPTIQIPSGGSVTMGDRVDVYVGPEDA